MKYEWKSTEEKPSKKRMFDMCWLDIGTKVVKGWWTGTCWDGLHYNGEEVVRWKHTLWETDGC